MAAKISLRGYLREKKGSSAVEFIMTVAMLILIFAVLVSALVYVTQFYSASYICRRVVRTIEVTGEGLTARCFCHELDHLDGILYIDNAVHILTPEETEEMMKEREQD